MSLLKINKFMSERVAKWGEFLCIEEALGGRARYAGADVLPLVGI
jgi:enolase